MSKTRNSVFPFETGRVETNKTNQMNKEATE